LKPLFLTSFFANVCFGFCTLSLLGSLPSQAARHALFLGAGGEPAEKATTIFDDILKPAGKALKAAGYQTQALVNGGHSETESKASKAFDGQRRDFTADAARASIKNYVTAIQSGKIREGDQLLVVVDTHGAPASAGTQSHQVAARGANFNMDELIALREAAEAGKVKLAILDFSCYSGNSLKLASDKTCVVTGSGELPGTTGYAEAFLKAAQSGRNLEDIFLRARREDKYMSTPEISTPAGRETMEILKFLSRNMVYTESGVAGGVMANDVTRSLEPYLRQCSGCTLRQIGDSLSKPATDLVDVLRGTYGISRYDMFFLKMAIRDHEAKLSKLADIRSQLHALETRTVSVGGIQFPWAALADANSINRQTIYHYYLKSEHAGNQNFFDQATKQLPHLAAAAAKLEDEEPEYSRYLALQNSFDRTQRAMRFEAKQVAVGEGTLYQSIYQKVLLEHPDSACKGFEF